MKTLKIVLTAFCITCLNLFSIAQIQSSDFELWDSSNVTSTIYPHDWPLLKDEYCVRSIDAYQGNYALMLSVWYYYVKTNAVQRSSINYRPLSLNGYYTYTENQVVEMSGGNLVTDTAIANVFLTHWNSLTQQNDTIGRGQTYLSQSLSYQYFDCPIVYSDTITPDSVIIVFDPSIIRRYINATTHQAPSNSMGKCSFLTLDNVQLTDGSSGIGNIDSETEIIVYPNPSSDHISIKRNKTGVVLLSVYNLAGEKIHSSILKNKEIKVDTGNLSIGTYLIILQDINGRTIQTKKIEVNR